MHFLFFSLWSSNSKEESLKFHHRKCQWQINVEQQNVGLNCRNPSLRLATKTRTCKGAGQKWSPGVAFHALRSVGECEGMNFHIPK